jgi:hypothetical protein
VSNIIVVVLSLVIIVIIVSNVILWSYQMNQLDWEKMHENVSISNVDLLARSSWFVTQNEFELNNGNLLNGSYLSTQSVDGAYEAFRESSPPREFDLDGTFAIDLTVCPLPKIQSAEIQLRYWVDDIGERWFLKAYNWTSMIYSDEGFNTTNGHSPNLGWNLYAVNLTDTWRSYVQNDGRMLIRVHDQSPDATRTNINIDFLGVRAVINGAIFTFQNKGAHTVHFVSIWVNNSTLHGRYDIDVFVNSGEAFSYQRFDIVLPDRHYTVKAVTERGNSAVYVAG